MEILFLILKIIGILFFIIFLLLLALITVPVRYRICMEAQDDIGAAGIFSWFCRLISFKIKYNEKDIAFQLRKLGVPMLRDREKHKNSKKRDKKHRKNPKSEIPSPKEPPVPEEPEPAQTPVSKEQQAEGGTEEQGGWMEDIRSKLKTLWQWILNMKDKTIAGKEKVQNIKKLVLEETNKSALLHLFQEFRYLVRHYSPRKASGDLAFSMGDPSRTGQILGCVSLLPFWARYRIQMTPDFQAEGFYIKGKLQLKGHIRAFHMIWSVSRLIKDKNIRALITRFRT